MMVRRGKLVGLGAVGLGIVVLSIAGFASRRVILEAWYLSKLSSTDEGTRKNAAKALGEYGSVRSIPPLMKANSDSLALIIKKRGKSLMRANSDSLMSILEQSENPDALVGMEKIFARLLDQRERVTRQIPRNSPDAAQEPDLAVRRQLRFLINQRRSLDARVTDLATKVATILAIFPC